MRESYAHINRNNNADIVSTLLTVGQRGEYDFYFILLYKSNTGIKYNLIYILFMHKKKEW